MRKVFDHFHPHLMGAAARRFRQAALFAAVAIALGACAQKTTKPQVTCANSDWFEIGRIDGAYGFPFKRIEDHQARCNQSSHPVDVDLYANGRNVGLLEYCTPTIGTQVGKDGKPYEGVCPAFLEKGFLSGYELGKRIRQLETENTDVATRMNELYERLGQPVPQVQNAPKSPGTLRVEFEQLRKRRAQIEEEINRLESQSF